MVEKLAQPGATMFERNLGIYAAQGLLTEVTVLGGVHEGYPAGLDDHFLQICTPGGELIILNLDQVIQIKPIPAIKKMSDEAKAKTEAFRSVCKAKGLGR